MPSARRYYTPAELMALPAAPAPRWPAVSMALLCLAAVLLPLGLVTALNVYLVALAVLVMLARRQGVPAELGQVLWPFVALIVVAFLRGLGAETYIFLRDGWYFSNPLLVMLVGYVLGRQVDDAAKGLRAIVVAGTLVAALHLLWFVLFPNLLALRASEVRSVTGSGYFAPVVAALILLGHLKHWRTGLRLPPALAWPCLLVNLASAALAFSRTLTVVLLVGALAVAGFFARRELLRSSVLVLVLLLAVLLARSAVSPESQEAKTSLVGKFGRVFEELRVTQDLRPQEIQDNWRGYETARAVGQWADGGPARWFLGEGLGALVDLGLFESLTRDPRDAVRFIPIFHNGYVFVLVKAGLVGIALYLLVLTRLYLMGRRHAGLAHAAPARRLGRLLQACAVSLFVSTGIFFGAFHKFDLLPVMLLSGYLMAVLAAGGAVANGGDA
jgi:hypothetical protein